MKKGKLQVVNVRFMDSRDGKWDYPPLILQIAGEKTKDRTHWIKNFHEKKDESSVGSERCLPSGTMGCM